jgi:hypothetical protein
MTTAQVILVAVSSATVAVLTMLIVASVLRGRGRKDSKTDRE